MILRSREKRTAGRLDAVLKTMQRRWCYFAHDRPQWPTGATYGCKRCTARHPVPYHIPKGAL